MFEGLRKVKKDIIKEVTDIGKAAKNLGREEMFDFAMEDESRRAVLEDRAWPTPEFAAEDGQMRAILMDRMRELSPQDLDGLEKSIDRVLAAQDTEREKIISDYQNAPVQYLRLAATLLMKSFTWTPVGAILPTYLEHRQIQFENKNEHDKAMNDLEERGKGIQEMIKDIRAHRAANDSQDVSDAA